MYVSCAQENLSRGLSIVGRAVSTRSTLPVLGNVLIATDGDNRLKLSATNLEIVITCWIEAAVQQPGSVTVPARTLSDLVSALPGGLLDLELNESTQTLHLASSRSEANIRGIKADEFPKVPAAAANGRFKLQTEFLRQMINQVAFAAATDDARPILTGVLTRFEGSEVTMAATDGFRLSVRSGQFPPNGQDNLEVIIPARALAELVRIVDDETEEIVISLSESGNQIIFDMDNILLVSQLIDGNFPDFKPVIPAEHISRAVFNTAEFAKACKMAEIFAREASHTARIRVVPGDEIMPGYATISATSTETGDNKAQIDANVEGQEIEIAFNVRYMAQILGVLDTPQVALETTKATAPGVIKPVGGENFVHIIMPMHFTQ